MPTTGPVFSVDHLLLFHLQTHIPVSRLLAHGGREDLHPSLVGRYSRSLSRRRPSRGSTIAFSETTIRPVSRKLPSPLYLELQ